MSANQGFSVRIFIPTGEPEGLRLVEKSNWTGHGLVFPRSLMPEARKRPELKRTGVYVVWGASEQGPLPRVYIGEGEVVLPRLERHVKEKDFWTQAAVFTSKDQNLNKAHVQYLEARLIQLASQAKRCELENGNVPQLPGLSEADKADAEGFLADMLLCLPLVGVAFFERGKTSKRKGPRLFINAKGLKAEGAETPEGFLVQAGGQAVKTEVTSIHAYISALRKTLVEKGVFEDAGDAYKLTQDYTFGSPSTASGVLLGRTANGRIDWKTKDGKTLKQLQEEQVSQSEE